MKLTDERSNYIKDRCDNGHISTTRYHFTSRETNHHVNQSVHGVATHIFAFSVSKTESVYVVGGGRVVGKEGANF